MDLFSEQSQKHRAGTPGEPADQRSAPQGDLPAVQNYVTESGERWRCERFQLLAAEVWSSGGLRVEGGSELRDRKEKSSVTQPSTFNSQLTEFHSLAARYTRGWFIARRYFGLSPLVLPEDAAPGDFQPLTRQQIAEALGITAAQFKAEVDGLRAAWNARKVISESVISESVTGSLITGSLITSEKGSLITSPLPLRTGDELLAEFGFDKSMFEFPERAAEANAAEKNAFLELVSDFRKELTEPKVKELARKMLLNALYLRRLEKNMATLSPVSKSFKDAAQTKSQLEETYQSQLNELDEIFPWKAGIGGKVGFKGAISELLTALTAYYAEQDNRLYNKIRAAGEVEIQLRQSVQQPEPRYRLGWDMAVLEAIQPHNMLNPNFKSQFTPRTLKKLDKIGKLTIDKVREEMGQELVDLEQPEGEWESNQ